MTGNTELLHYISGSQTEQYNYLWAFKILLPGPYFTSCNHNLWQKQWVHSIPYICLCSIQNSSGLQQSKLTAHRNSHFSFIQNISFKTAAQIRTLFIRACRMWLIIINGMGAGMMRATLCKDDESAPSPHTPPPGCLDEEHLNLSGQGTRCWEFSLSSFVLL